MDLTDLERRQIHILQRIRALEKTVLPSSTDKQIDTHDNEECENNEQRLGKLLRVGGATSFQFKKVPHDYYDRPLQLRRDLLAAHSIRHLCKTMVMVNTLADKSIKDCSDRNNSKYYAIVIQYTARLNAEKVRNFVHSLNNGKIPKKKFNMRLAPEEDAFVLSGYEHNAITPIGMKTNIPVILSDAIVKLKPDYFWIGGGEVDVKLGIRTQEFINFVKPFIVDCSED
ncbi:hypothetical protein KI387_001827 [Taxus chinensis]|uniref:YbaK/aminoacyl-tRNA synthetase-associated domain-containing protein n=1 Tax=Taxus chinensis TaxID=29808 RepID=A0AA38LMW6_TAXCH|nr:hypothetical protein KI387_001827 [Taxus chinensis]